MTRRFSPRVKDEYFVEGGADAQVSTSLEMVSGSGVDEREAWFSCNEFAFSCCEGLVVMTVSRQFWEAKKCYGLGCSY